MVHQRSWNNYDAPNVMNLFVLHFWGFGHQGQLRQLILVSYYYIFWKENRHSATWGSKAKISSSKATQYQCDY